MTRKQVRWHHPFRLLVIGVFTLSPLPAIAQRIPIPDDTLGTERSLVTPVNPAIDQIDGGARRGANLFHSFREFNVDVGRGVYFANPAGVVNILTRVTGGNRSEILGTLGVLGTANLFLINPNGILFGPNAQLDVRGSFLASTANSFKFPDGSEFSATTPQAPPLLTINVPLGLQTGAIPAGSAIASRGNLTAGQDLTLESDRLDLQGQLVAGRDLTLQATNTVTARDSTTVPFVAAAGGNLLVQGNQGVDIAVLNHPSSGVFAGGNLMLRSDQAVGGDAHFYAGGNFQVEQLNGSPGNLFSPQDPIIFTNGDVTLGNYTGASLHILAGGSVTLNNVTINNVGSETTTINPNNNALFNGSRSYADLASFNLTKYEPTFNSDGSVRSVAPLAVTIAVQGNTQATLDVRAGVDWAALGGLPTNQVLPGTPPPILPQPFTPGLTAAPSSANITVNGNVQITQPAGLVLLTNQYSPNTLPGTIAIRGNVDASTNISKANGGDIQIYGRGDIAITGPGLSASNRLDSSSSSNSDSGNGGKIAIATNSGNISLAYMSLNSFSFSGSGVVAASSKAGNGGEISLTTNSGNISLIYSDLGVLSRSFSDSELSNAGNGGRVSFVTNSGDISITRSRFLLESRAYKGNAGNGGEISLATNSGNISLINYSRWTLFSFTNFSNIAGNGGKASFATNSGTISVPSLDLYSNSDSGTRGNGGKISFATDSGNILLANSYFDSSTSSRLGNGGNGGRISLTTNSGSISLTNSTFISDTSSTSGNSGNGGAIVVDTNSGNISLATSSLSSTSASDTGNAGDGGSINLSAKGGIISGSSIVLNSFSVSQTGGSGNGGKVTLEADREVSGLQINTVASGGLSGDVELNGFGNLQVTNTRILTAQQVEVKLCETCAPITINLRDRSQAGNVAVTSAGSLAFRNSLIQSDTRSGNPAGDVTISANQGITLADRSTISARTISSGKAGNITISAPSLTIAQQASVTATATATATNQGGGNITLNTSKLDLAGIVGVFAETQGVAPAGALRLNPYTNQPDLEIALTPNSQISASTSSSGKGGDLIVTAPQSITISGSGRLAVETSSTGNAGNMSLITRQLTLKDGVEISASTSNSGNAGNIAVVAERFDLLTGARISTNTSSSGPAGNLTVQVSDRLFLTGQGTGLFASTAPGSTGTGGNITIDPRLVQIENGATIAVDSQGRGTGGNISVQTDRVTLNRQGSITAETASAQGGNITLDVKDVLVLRRNSLISATAGTAQAGGDGGNITFTGNFIVAVPNENSDISANAFTGSGGRVTINAQGIFGIQFRPQLTPLSDITASSDFGAAGVVAITTPDVDPNRGLVQLPVDLSDASRLIVQTCPTGNAAANQFIITGRGGLPPTPSEAVHRDAIQVDLVTIAGEHGSSISQRGEDPQRSSIPSTQQPDQPIVEATGFQVAPDGTVLLVAGNAANSLTQFRDRLIHCSGSTHD
jgi:filamentous hemagglutinin family protein